MKKLSEKSRKEKCVKLHQDLVKLRLNAEKDGLLAGDVIVALDYHKSAVLLELFMNDIIEVLVPTFQPLYDRVARLEKKLAQRKRGARK